MIEKIKSKAGSVYEIDVPENASGSKEIYISCPICSPYRQHKHHKEKKFAINIIKKSWRCNHCGEGGYFLNDEEYKKYKISPLRKKVNILELSDRQGLMKWLNDERKISKAVLKELNIGISITNITIQYTPEDKEEFIGKYMSRECVAFKFLNNGAIINVAYRDEWKNFKFETGADLIFWNIDAVKDSSVKEIIITEGFFDVASFYMANLKNAISVPNGIAISKDEVKLYKETGKFDASKTVNLKYVDKHFSLLDSKERFIIATDDDIPGKKLREELVQRLGKERCSYIEWGKYEYNNEKGEKKKCKDANDLLIHGGPEKILEAYKSAKSYPIDDVFTIDDVWENIESQYYNGLSKGLSIGYKTIDPHFSVKLGHTLLINGHFGMGKTTFMFNLCVILALKYKWPIMIYTPENYPVSEAMVTLIEIYLGETIDKDYRKNNMTIDKIKKAKKFINDYFFFVDNEDGYNPTQFLKLAKHMIRKHGIRVIVKDPWNAMEEDKRHGEGTFEYLRRVLTNEVKFANRYGIYNIINAHPPTPDKGFIRLLNAPSPLEVEGGSIWSKKMYEIVCIHVPYTNDWKDTTVEFYVQKVKNHKLIGVPTKDKPIVLKFDRRSQRYYEDNYCPLDDLIGNKAVQQEVQFINIIDKDDEDDDFKIKEINNIIPF